MPQYFDWRTASQPADVVRPVVTALQQGGLALLPTDAGYVIAAAATQPESVSRMLAAAGAGTADPVMLVAGVAGLESFGGALGSKARRLLTRLWPGPLASRVEKSPWRFWAPRHTAIEAVLLESGCPLLAFAANRAVPSEEAAGMLAAPWDDTIAVVLDAGPLTAKPLTQLEIEGDGWRIERAGAVSEADILAAAADWIVFVCTGNTCRSPMAEALFKARLASKLGCNIEELPARGYRIFSAGVSAYPGDAPSPEAVDVLHDLGADLEPHRSQPLAVEVAAQADQLIAMTRSHLLAVITRYPAIGGSLRLLCGAEGDLDDPIGGSREVYAACAQTIAFHLDRFIQELVR